MPVSRAISGDREDAALCVLGCRVGSKALARRARAAAESFHGGLGALVVACGGRAWGGLVEADELARMMAAAGVAEDAIVRERCSFDTRDNARFAAALLARRGVGRVVVVTCSWHMPRAARLFAAEGLEVVGTVGVDPPDATPFQRLYWNARERLSSWNEARRARPRTV